MSQAEATRANLNAQRAVFTGVGSKLGMFADVAPKIDALIGAIGRRKLRDKMILGLLIGSCTSLLLLYAMS